MNAVVTTTAPAVSSSDRELLMELVAGISKPSDVLARFGITPQDFAAKCRDPQFLATWREIKRTWGSDLNASERVRKISAFLLEDMVVDMVQAAKVGGVSPGVKRDAVEALAKISDNWEPAKHKKDGGQIQAVKISINFGQQPSQHATVEGEAVQQEWPEDA